MTARTTTSARNAVSDSELLRTPFLDSVPDVEDELPSEPDPTIYVAPTEPLELRALGVSTFLPEESGVDILWESPLGIVGVQRKKFPSDFLASVHDGRLNKEYAQMRSLDVAVLLLEGKEFWAGKNLASARSHRQYTWTRTQHRNYLASVQMRGVHVHSSDSIPDTVSYLRDLYTWTYKGDHTSLDSRPSLKADGWSRLSNRDFQSYLLQSIPGIGPKQAAAIIGHFGGCPIHLSVTAEELREVPGIGKKLAERMVRVFNG